MWQSEGVPVEEGVERSRNVGLTASSPLYPPGTQVSEDSRLCGSLYSDTSFASSFNPDNVSIERHPVLLGWVDICSTDVISLCYCRSHSLNCWLYVCFSVIVWFYSNISYICLLFIFVSSQMWYFCWSMINVVIQLYLYNNTLYLFIIFFYFLFSLFFCAMLCKCGLCRHYYYYYKRKD